MVLNFLLVFLLFHSTKSFTMEDLGRVDEQDREKLLCLNRMIDPENISIAEFENSKAAYDYLIDKNVHASCRVEMQLDTSIDAVNLIIYHLEAEQYVDKVQSSKLKQAVSQDKCKETVSIKTSPAAICKTYSFTSWTIRAGKQYNFAYSCCEVVFGELSKNASPSKHNAAIKYITFLLKKKMIDEVGSDIQNAIDFVPILPKPTEKPAIDPNDFTFGNTCYCNSVIQALYFCRPFREKVLNYKHQLKKTGSPKENLLTCLADLFHNIATQKKRVGTIAPKKFVGRLKKENELFDNYMQQDAHEFLNYLLNTIGDILLDEKRKSPSMVNRSCSKFNAVTPQQQLDVCQLMANTNGPACGGVVQRDNSVWVHDIFQGTLTNETRCLNCESMSRQHFKLKSWIMPIF